MTRIEERTELIRTLADALLGDEHNDGTIWDCTALEETPDRRIKIWTDGRVPAFIDLDELADLLMFEGVRVVSW